MCSSHSTRHSARTVAESATNRDLRLALVRVTLGNLKRKIKTEHSLRSQTDLSGSHNLRAGGTEDIHGGYLQYMAATYFCVKEVAVIACRNEPVLRAYTSTSSFGCHCWACLRFSDRKAKKARAIRFRTLAVSCSKPPPPAVDPAGSLQKRAVSGRCARHLTWPCC